MGTEEIVKSLDNREFLDMLYGFAYKRCNSSHEADDLCSDIILEVLKSIHRGSSIDNFYAYVWTIAHRTYADFCEKRKVLSNRFIDNYSDDTVQMQTDPFNDYIESEADKALIHHIKKEISFLSKIYREVFVMYYLDEMKTSEISQKLSISDTTVKQRLFSARNLIKKEVEKMNSNDITLKPINMYFLGSGNPVGNDPRIKAERLLSQNLIYLCKDIARSAKELSELLGVPMVYIEEELDIQCRGLSGTYGLLRKLDNGKYITNFFLVDASDYAKASEVYDKQLPLLMDKIKNYIADNSDRILSFPFLNKQNDIKFITWSLISRMIWSYQSNVYQTLKNNYLSDVDVLKRDFSVFGIATKNNEPLRIGFYGCDGNRAYNICGYNSVVFVNIYGEHIKSHFSCGHNLSSDPLLLMAIKSIEGIPVDTLSEEEKEIAAKAIECDYLTKCNGVIYPKILMIDSEKENAFYDLSNDFAKEALDLYEEAAAMLYDQVKKFVPKHLINEYDTFILQITQGLLSKVIDQCIKEGIISIPENKPCAEGTWMILEK